MKKWLGLYIVTAKGTVEQDHLVSTMMYVQFHFVWIFYILLL